MTDYDPEYTTLFAVHTVMPGSLRDHQHAAQEQLHSLLQQNKPGSPIESWWVAEDDRTDGSDCDSAVFVKPGAQAMAARLLVMAGLTWDHNIRPPEPGGQYSTPDAGDDVPDWQQVIENIRAAFAEGPAEVQD